MPNFERLDYQPPLELQQEKKKRDHKRPDRLAAYVALLLEEFETGERTTLPSPHELGELFDYQNTVGMTRSLSNRGLLHRLEQAYKEANIVYPSNEWAWMLGILALGGSTSPHNQQISLTSSDPYLLNAFSLRGANLFHMNPASTIDRAKSDGRETRRVFFGNGYMVKALGDLRRESWPETISEKHRWIYEDDEYIWSFLEGVCEVRGVISNKPGKRRITVNTNFRQVANTISDLLVRVGIDQPRDKRDSSTREGIRGVEVGTLDDVTYLAQHIHSVNPKREEILQELRELDIKSPARVNSLDEVVDEWIRLRNLLGRVPNSSDIPRLKKLGETPYSIKVYMNWSGGNSWVNSARFFEDMVRNRESS